MKTSLITIAAALTMLFALGGCNFRSNGNETTESANQSNTTTQFNFTLDQFLVHVPVELASGNTLATTPADLQDIVSGFDIDLRNSAYLILQKVKNDDLYTNGSGKYREFLFTLGSILYPAIDDPGVLNAMAKDYNDCVKEIGVERLNQGEGQQCSEQWGKSWKTQVVDKFLRSSALQNSLYTWVKPEMRRVFNALNSDQRVLMKNAFDHMISYTANYNHQTEKQFYRDCCNSSYGEHLFVLPYKIVDMTPNTDVVVNPYRFLETWVYRRVEDNTMTVAQINEWLRKIKVDMGV